MKRLNIILLVLSIALSVVLSSMRQANEQQAITRTVHLHSKIKLLRSPAKPVLEDKQIRLKVRYKAGEVDHNADIPDIACTFPHCTYSVFIYCSSVCAPLAGATPDFYLRGPPMLA